MAYELPSAVEIDRKLRQDFRDRLKEFGISAEATDPVLAVLFRTFAVELEALYSETGRIRTALLQVVSNVLDFGMSVSRAVAAPRLHWDGEQLQVEPGFDPGAVRSLPADWRANLWPESDLYFGGVHAVDPAGEGAGDPRRGGAARVLE